MPDRPTPPLCPLETELEALMQIDLTEDLEEIPMDDKPDILTWQKTRERGPSPEYILKLCEVYGEDEVIHCARALGWPPIAIIHDRRTDRRVIEMGATPFEAQFRARAAWEGKKPRPDAYVETLEETVNTVCTALRNLCLAVEEWLGEEDRSDLFDHYEAARAVLGEPIVPLPGGPDGDHFHFLGFDPEEDGCAYCEDAARAKEETAGARTGS